MGSHRGFYQSSGCLVPTTMESTLIATSFVRLMESHRQWEARLACKSVDPAAICSSEEQTRRATLGNRMKLNGCVHSPCLCTLPVSTLIVHESISTLCGQCGSFWAEARRPFGLSANSTIPRITLLLFQKQRRKRKALGEKERLGPFLSDLLFSA
jgi:hypothetical protein